MSFNELVVAYFQHHAVIVYLVLMTAGIFYVVTHDGITLRNLLVVIITFQVYPLVWYLLHRYVLHSRYLYRFPSLAKTWKRIHYDHHQDPNDLRVLFGALQTTLPTIALVTLPVGWAIGGVLGAVTAFSAGTFSTLFYEFSHCIQHLRFSPKSRFFKRIKKLHLMHHFYNEDGNYGITNYFWDKVFGSYYGNVKTKPRSNTVFNLGYDEEQSSRYPWVAQISENNL
jgi:sterol desaturase/sphingolipid hydroxylase (fatty acid hydroxylase superfamily)